MNCPRQAQRISETPPESQRIVFQWIKQELFQAHRNIPFQDRFSKRWIVPGRAQNLKYSTWELFFIRDELFQAHNVFPLQDRFQSSTNCSRLPGMRHILRLTQWESFFTQSTNCSRRTTYFHLRIVFLHDEFFQVCSTYCAWLNEDRFSTAKNCFRHTTYFHLRIAFQKFLQWRDELFQASTTYFHLRIAFQSD